MVAVPSTFSTLPRASSLLLSHESNPKIISSNNTYILLKKPFNCHYSFLKPNFFTLRVLSASLLFLYYMFNQIDKLHDQFTNKSHLSNSKLSNVVFLAVESSSAKFSGSA